jgi:hypothetical protein
MGNRTLTRRGVLSLTAFLPLAARAEEGAALRDPVPALYAADPLSGLALRGYDPVSYALGAPLPGRAAWEGFWSGLSWRFAGPANRAAFLRDPEVYAPRLGGYDPLGIADGHLVEADPLVPLLRDGRLYLFRSPAHRAAADAAVLAGAEARWPSLREGVMRE